MSTGSLTILGVDGGQVTFGASIVHDCTGVTVYCGWIATVRATTPGSDCSTDADLIWVGPITEEPSAAYTSTEWISTWIGGPQPLRLCLYVYDGVDRLVAQTDWLPPVATPAPVIPTPAPVVPAPTPVPTSVPTPRAPTLTLARARRASRSALRDRFGGRFTVRRDYSARCARRSRIRFRCTVAWTHAGRYRGTVTLWSVRVDDETYVDWNVSVRRVSAPAPRKPEPSPRATPTPTPRPTPRCDPSYPTVCIPPPPPDLDCGDISYENFTVRGADPHRFDGDDDGIGCES